MLCLSTSLPIISRNDKMWLVGRILGRENAGLAPVPQLHPPAGPQIGAPPRRVPAEHRVCSLLEVSEDLWVENGEILNPERVFFDGRRAAGAQIDCGGAIVSPGFVDIQVNGAASFQPFASG